MQIKFNRSPNRRLCVNFNLTFDRFSRGFLLTLKIVMRLQIHPKLCRYAEITRQSQSRIGADGTLAMNDLVYASRRHADVFRDAVLRKPIRHEKLEGKNFAWVYGCKLVGHKFNRPTASRPATNR